jgi:S1-C subfamily serine protease
MKKRLISLIMVVVLVVSIAPAALAYSSAELSAANALYTMELFQGTGTDNNGAPIYSLDDGATREQALVMLIRLLGKEDEALSKDWEHPFTDVSNWAKKYIGYAYATGLTTGQTATTFGGGNTPVSARDYITFVLRALGYTSGTDFSWNTAYSMSDSLGFTSGEYNASSVIDRGNMAEISYNALGVKIKNTSTTLLASLVADGTVSRANVTSAGAEALLTGLANIGSSTGSATLTAKEIYAAASPAVFYLQVYNSAGTATASGSGFFITSDGVALTCYHVIDDTASAKIQTTDGNIYQVTHVLYYNEDRDVAVIRVSKTSTSGTSVSSFPYLTRASLSTVSVGDSVYALGSPLGLSDTFTTGIVSSKNRVAEGQSFIQTDASISSGSSGGALLNDKGEVIGITAATFSEGQNLNLAIPVDCISGVNLTQTGTAYATVQQTEHPTTSNSTSTSGGSSANAYVYNAYPDVPDFGKNLGVTLYTTAVGDDNDYTAYFYKAASVIAAGHRSDWETAYIAILEQFGFTYKASSNTGSIDVDFYYNKSTDRTVAFGLASQYGIQYVFVQIFN